MLDWMCSFYVSSHCRNKEFKVADSGSIFDDESDDVEEHVYYFLFIIKIHIVNNNQ